MKTKIIIFRSALLILLGIVCSSSYSQNAMNWEWANNIEGTNKDYPYSLATDKEGNNYVVGSFSDTLKVGTITLISKGSFDIYLLKYDAKGVLLWAKQAGGSDLDEAYGVALDEEGNIYMTGYFSGYANFSGMHVKSNGDRDFFVAKYGHDGELIWIKQGGGVIDDYGTAVVADKSGNIFVTGVFKGALNIGNTSYVSKGNKNIFIIKYNNKGDIIWSTTGGGSMADESTSMVTDVNGNIYVTGDFEGTAEFNKKVIVSEGKKDVFLAKYNNDGEIQWLKRGGSSSGVAHASSIALDKADNIYVTGYFSGQAYFGKTGLKNLGSDDIFLVKYNPNGDEIWAKQTGETGDERARALILDKAGNIYVTGEFNFKFKFCENNICNLGASNIFILKYSNNGDMLAGTQIGGAGYDKAYGIGLDDISNIYVVGFFSKAISIGNTNLRSIDADDSFIAKLKSF